MGSCGVLGSLIFCAARHQLKRRTWMFFKAIRGGGHTETPWRHLGMVESGNLWGDEMWNVSRCIYIYVIYIILNIYYILLYFYIIYFLQIKMIQDFLHFKKVKLPVRKCLTWPARRLMFFLGQVWWILRLNLVPTSEWCKGTWAMKKGPLVVGWVI